MPTTTDTTGGTTLVQNVPSTQQQQTSGGVMNAAGQLVWPEGNFALAPRYPGDLTAPQGEQTVNWYSNVNAMQQPDFGRAMEGAKYVGQQAMAGTRDPNQIGISGNYQNQQFQVNPFQFNDPFAGYNGGQAMQIRAPQGVGASAADYRTNVDQVRAPEGVQYDRISGLPQISAPNLQNYQMAGPERVTAPGGLNAFQLNAPERVSAGTVGTQSFIQPGTAASYMSPYQQNVLDVQKQRAEQDYNQQLTGVRSQAAKSGAFGGTRQAVEESTMNRDLQDRMASIQATGQQQAFQAAQQQFNQEQALGLQGQTTNVQTGLQAGLANQQAGMQTSLANQQAALAAQGLGTNAQMQAALANQQAGLTTGGQNLQALLGVQALGSGQNMQGQLANQQMSYQQQLANQQAGLQSGMFNNQQAMQAQQLNQAANLQAGMQAQQLGAQGAQFNAGMDYQTQMANQAAQQQQFQRQYGAMGQQGGWGMQAGLQGQNLGMQAQQLGMQSNQFGAGLDLQGQVAQQQARTAAQNANLNYLSLAGNMNQQAGNWQQQGYNNAATQAGLYQNAAVNQQGYDQGVADRNYADWQRQQNYPYQQLDWLANLQQKMPPQGSTMTTQQGVQYQSTPNPNIWNQVIGGLATAAGTAAAFV
jgi:hypothetical protein